jgi:hypothetical protein
MAVLYCLGEKQRRGKKEIKVKSLLHIRGLLTLRISYNFNGFIC